MNYNNSKIYKLWSHETDLIYIGSTNNMLAKRFYTHKSDYKRWKEGKSKNRSSACDLFELGEVMIELIEAYPCNNKDELRAREGYWIRKEVCVNKRIEDRTQKEYKKDNEEKIKEYTKDWNIQHKDYHKDYYKNNKKQIRDKQAEWRQNNQEKIIEWREEKKRKNYYNYTDLI